MSSRRLFLPALLLVLWTCFQPALGSSGDRVSKFLSFTVKSRFDIYVRDLKREEVTLRIDGRPVEIGFLAGEDVSTATAIFLENSPRTAPHMISVPQWGQVNAIDRIRYEMFYNFFEPLCRFGPVLLAEYFEETKILQDFTTVDSQLVNALHRMQPMSTGILFDNIEVGRVLGRGVDWLRDRQERRKVLILMTTTVDRQSYQNLEEYKLMLRNTGIDLYVVSFALRFPSGNNFSFEEKMNRSFFRELAGETGGLAYVTGEFSYFDDLFTDLKGRLFNSYTIGFYVEPGEEISEHEVELEVSREGAKLTHRPLLVY